MTTLLLLLTGCGWTSSDGRASMVVEPSRSQFFEYERFSLKCERFGFGGWTVWRYTTSGSAVSQCGSAWGSQQSSTCHMTNVKVSNTGVYWCQSKHGDSSDSVNITITDTPVILQSPVQPLTEGGNVTLRCRMKETSNPQAQFYKDGAIIGSGPEGHMTIHQVSMDDEGVYKCSVQGGGESLLSWLLIEDGSDSASLTVSPDSSQMFEYQHLVFSCGHNSSSGGWRLLRVTASVSTVSACGHQWGLRTESGCSLLSKQTDSGLYWCESPERRRSNSVNITVYDKPVILEIPVLPVEKGDNVTLHCRSRRPSCPPAAFYKDGSHLRTESSCNTTVHVTSKSDEGVYKCYISGSGESPSSWLFVRGPDEGGPPEALTVMRVVRYLVVWCPYVISTVLMASLYRHKATGPVATRRRNTPVSMETPSAGDVDDDPNQQYDDVMAAVTTEHRF